MPWYALHALVGVCFGWVEICHYGMVYLNPFRVRLCVFFVDHSHPRLYVGVGFFNVVLTGGAYAVFDRQKRPHSA